MDQRSKRSSIPIAVTRSSIPPVCSDSYVDRRDMILDRIDYGPSRRVRLGAIDERPSFYEHPRSKYVALGIAGIMTLGAGFVLMLAMGYLTL